MQFLTALFLHNQKTDAFSRIKGMLNQTYPTYCGFEEFKCTKTVLWCPKLGVRNFWCVLHFRIRLIHGPSDEPSWPSTLKVSYTNTHTHTQPHTYTLTTISLLVFICGPTGGSTDTSGRGTIFLYISVNKILIHVFIFWVFGFFLPLLRIFKKKPSLLTKMTNKHGQKRVESHLYRTLYLHGPSQCKIETLFMEILTKRPFSTEHSL